MPRLCTICQHEKRQAIDKALVGGEGVTRISALFRVSPDAVDRHRAHVPKQLARAQEAREVAKADDLLQEVRALRTKAYSLLLAAEREGDLKTALAGVGQARACLELLAKLLGELDERPQLNLILAPEWVRVRTVLMDALRPYPEVRQVVAAALVREGAADGRE